MTSCTICDVERHIVARDSHWTVRLNDDQAHLGRCFFALGRHDTDVTNLTQAERDSLWAHLSKLNRALDTLFAPDHVNFVFLMNVAPHVHAHLIPRYASERNFDGHVFLDTNYGGHYDPAASLILPEETQTLLAATIREAFAK